MLSRSELWPVVGTLVFFVVWFVFKMQFIEWNSISTF